jgi:hypothetical protein
MRIYRKRGQGSLKGRSELVSTICLMMNHSLTINRNSLSIYLSMYLSVCLSIYLYVFLFIYLSVCLYAFLSIYLSIYPSICLSVCLSIYLSIYLSTYLSIYLSIIHLSIYGSIALYWALAAFSVSWSFYTVGMTPWTGDQPVAKPQQK